MNRYCTRCCKEYDFKIISMEELDNLICPVCGQKIDKNSRKPRDTETENQIEEAIGEGFYTVFKLAYFFYLICGIIGIIFFTLKWNKLLYIDTALCLITYAFRFGGSVDYRRWDSLFIVLGGALGFYLFPSLEGVCVGIMAGFIVRHIFRTIIYRLFAKFIGWCNRL